MAASPSAKTINAKIRYELKKLAAKYGLEYVKGTALTYPSLKGTIMGRAVEAGYKILRASNGEVAGVLCVSVDGKVDSNYFGSFENKLAILGVKV